MLTLKEREIAERALALAINRVDKPRAVLLAMVADDDFGFDFPLDPPTVRELARAAIQMCEESKWDRLPPWLQQILTKVAQTPQIQGILAKIAIPPPDWKTTLLPDPFDAFWLSRLGLPFLGRLNLRQALKQMNTETGLSVLVINGPEKSGKSYCVELIKHAVQEQLALVDQNSFVPLARVKFQTGMGASLTPEKLATLILAEITVNPRPLPILDSSQEVVTDDRLNEHLCDWIIENAEETGELWWVALDGLNDADLSPATRNFISKLVELVGDKGKHGSKMRVVIIDYPTTQLIGAFPGKARLEELGPIGEVDVEEFLKSQLEETGEEPTAREVKLTRTLAMLNLPEDETRLQALNDKLKLFVFNLSRQ